MKIDEAIKDGIDPQRDRKLDFDENDPDDAPHQSGRDIARENRGRILDRTPTPVPRPKFGKTPQQG